MGQRWKGGKGGTPAPSVPLETPGQRRCQRPKPFPPPPPRSSRIGRQARVRQQEEMEGGFRVAQFEASLRSDADVLSR